jgi:hypothetical protein
MSNIVVISTVKEDSDGEPYIELNPALIRQMGWDSDTMFEWEVMSSNTVMIKEKNAGSST